MLSAEYARRASKSILKKTQSASVCQSQDLISFSKISGGIVFLILKNKYLG
jgi:hypothetical protein